MGGGSTNADDDTSTKSTDFDDDWNTFQDLDLAIFGFVHIFQTMRNIYYYNKYNKFDCAICRADAVEYAEYAARLEQEYIEQMDPKTYKNMRLKILQTFLTIPNIYATEIFRNKFETIARDNIAQEIMELKK